MLPGCVKVAVEGVKAVYVADKRAELTPRAEAGEARAQYALGKTYCCGVDNQEATTWLCAAAHQGHAGAQYQLAKIYSGDLVDGINLTKRAYLSVAAEEPNAVLALAWAIVAVEHGSYDAVDLAAELREGLTPGDAAVAEGIKADWRKAPCLWSEVYG